MNEECMAEHFMRFLYLKGINRLANIGGKLTVWHIESTIHRLWIRCIKNMVTLMAGQKSEISIQGSTPKLSS